MLRLILLIALILAATYLVEALVRQVRRQLGDPGGGGRIGAAGPRRRRRAVDFRRRRRDGDLQSPGGVELIACSHCGVHTPASRALWYGRAGPFCCEACRRQAMAAPP